MSIHSQNKFGLLGKSLGHSFSKKYFNQKFIQEGIQAVYENYELEKIDHLESSVLSDPDLRGFNVTFPYKRAILPFLDFMDESVRLTGACNTVLRTEGYLIGYNTDVRGFLALLKSLHGVAKQGKALILGTGGAASAVMQAFDSLNRLYAVVSRSDNYDFRYDHLTKEVLKEYAIIVQATPLGTSGTLEKECPAIPYDGIHEGHTCIDLNYNPEKTVFLEKCLRQGAKIANGQHMLKEQAEEAWRIWNNYAFSPNKNENKI